MSYPTSTRKKPSIDPSSRYVSKLKLGSEQAKAQPQQSCNRVPDKHTIPCARAHISFMETSSVKISTYNIRNPVRATAPSSEKPSIRCIATKSNVRFTKTRSIRQKKPKIRIVSTLLFSLAYANSRRRISLIARYKFSLTTRELAKLESWPKKKHLNKYTTTRAHKRKGIKTFTLVSDRPNNSVCFRAFRELVEYV